MTKRTVKTYVYKDKKLVATTNSVLEAAEYANTNSTTVSICANGSRRNTFNGWWFSYQPLSQDELDDIYTEKAKRTKRSNDECKEREGSFEYAVDCDERQVTYIPRSRKAKVEQLRRLIWASNYRRWLSQPKKLAALERRAYKELLNSLI